MLGRLLEVCVRRSASDLHLRPGSPPVGRIDGKLIRLTDQPLETDAVAAICRAACTPEQWSEVEDHGTTDLGIEAAGARFRVSVLRERTGFAAVMRQVPKEVMSFDAIGLPHHVRDLLRKPRGLMLLTGPTGSGKSTTLATMVDWINQHSDRHIVTIEDPVEFVHSHRRGLVTQREVGPDVPSFG